MCWPIFFEDSHQKFVTLMKLSLENNEGNLWMAFQDVMEAMLSFCSKRSNFELLKNIMAHVNSDDMLSGFSRREEVIQGFLAAQSSGYMNTWMIKI